MTIGSWLRGIVLGTALATTTNEAIASTAPSTYEDSTGMREQLQGTASHYGTPVDRFGYVDREDPRIQLLLKQNGISPSNLPVRFVAAEALTAAQMIDLYKTDKDKYRLLTANGKPFNPNAPCVAMNKRYLGKIVKITNTGNNKSIIVQVTDTGKFEEKYGRVADLSTAAAQKLGYVAKGKAHVLIEVLK